VVDEAHACVGTRQGRQQRFELLKRLTEDPERHMLLLEVLTATGNPEIQSRFLKAQLSFSESERAVREGNIARAAAQIQKFESDFIKVSEDANKAEVNAREEIELWREMEKMSSFLGKTLADRLDSFGPGSRSGEDMRNWAELKLDIENLVVARAGSTRELNASAIRAKAKRLRISWDSQSLPDLEKFARGVGQRAVQTIKDSALDA
jgi:hypothetical protein